MSYHVYVKDLLGVCSNIDRVSWIYGENPPVASKAEYESCLVRVNLEVRDPAFVFDASLERHDYDVFSHFFGRTGENRLYYERPFFLNSKMRFQIEMSDYTVNMIVSSNYYRYVRHRFMNLHSVGYILSDVVSGLLLKHGFSTIYCSAVKCNDRTVVIFGPPQMGKTVTAIQLCADYNCQFISEDMALTDGISIFAAPWTSTYRHYESARETRTDRLIGRMISRLPILQLVKWGQRPSFMKYLEQAVVVDSSRITDVVFLRRGDSRVVSGGSDLLHCLLNLSKYGLNYHRSPTMIAMSYFNPELNLDALYQVDRGILRRLLESARVFEIYTRNPTEYAEQISRHVLA
jgi:hypothetical protein